MMADMLSGLDIPSVFLGFLLSGILGFILQKIRLQRGIMKSPSKPMAVYTKKTPDDVQNEASKAFWRFLGWMIIMILAVGFLLVFLLFYINIPQKEHLF